MSIEMRYLMLVGRHPRWVWELLYGRITVPLHQIFGVSMSEGLFDEGLFDARPE